MINRIRETLASMSSDPSQQVREAAAEAMDRVMARCSVDRFRALLKEGNLEEKIHVVHAAGEIGGGEGIALLLEALSDQSEVVRAAAVLELHPFTTPAVLKVLWEMLPREKGVVLGNIIEALGVSGRKELGPQVERYLAHPDMEVRAKAVIALSRLADAAGWEKILAMSGDRNETIRLAVSQGLGGWTSARP